MKIHLAALAVFLLASGPCLEGAEPDAVAIIYGVSGEAWIKAAPSAPRRPAQPFEWLPGTAEVEVAPRATVLVAFATGTRFELGGGARATLSPAGGFRASTGPVRALPSVSPMPRFEPLAAEARPGARAGALRIRGGRIHGLYPRDDARVLPDQAVLSFEPVPGTPRYKVQVEDESGNAVFDAEVRTSSVVISPGVLKPGGRYYWTVRSLGGPAAARGEAEFSVLPTDGLAAREALRRSLEGPADAQSLALLAEVDSRLGLLLEAQRGLRDALKKAPDDPALKAAVERLERQLTDADRDPQP